MFIVSDDSCVTYHVTHDVTALEVGQEKCAIFIFVVSIKNHRKLFNIWFIQLFLLFGNMFMRISIVTTHPFFFFFFMHFCPGTITTHTESINSDLQRGLDRRLRHIQH